MIQQPLSWIYIAVRRSWALYSHRLRILMWLDNVPIILFAWTYRVIYLVTTRSSLIYLLCFGNFSFDSGMFIKQTKLLNFLFKQKYSLMVSVRDFQTRDFSSNLGERFSKFHSVSIKSTRADYFLCRKSLSIRNIKIPRGILWQTGLSRHWSWLPKQYFSLWDIK